MTRGRIFSFSGIDGVGKSTQARALLEAMQSDGRACVAVTELAPDSSYETGAELASHRRRLAHADVVLSRFYLRSSTTRTLAARIKREQLLDRPGAPLVAEAARSALVDARAWFEQVVDPLLAGGTSFIFDRFYHDELAYRSLYGVDTIALAAAYAKFPSPDRALWLRLGVAELLDRNRTREDGRSELFSRPDKLRLLDGRFAGLARRYGLIELDAARDPVELGRSIVQLIDTDPSSSPR